MINSEGYKDETANRSNYQQEDSARRDSLRLMDAAAAEMAYRASSGAPASSNIEVAE